jgi:two-component system LytT family response regulator
MLTAVIIDDERLARVNLRNLLLPFTNLEIIGEADSCKSAIELINACKPNLVFLDIQLTGESGFDILEKIEYNIKIIFVTAFDEFAIRAFEVNAIDYLLKPVNPVRLAKAIEKISVERKNENALNKTLNFTDSIYVKLTNSVSKFIKINSIASISSYGNYTKVLMSDGERYVILKTLKQWEMELPNKYFVRIHRTDIINIEFISRVERYSLSFHRVYLKNNAEPFQISRRYMANLKKNYQL